MDFLNRIKKAFFLPIFPAVVFLTSLNAFSQNGIEGVWKSDDGKYMMKIASFGDDFQGRIVWMEEENDASGNPKLDAKNPDEKLQKLPIKGSKILKGLSFNASGGNWIGGTIYLPESGKEYKCKAELKGGMLIISYDGDNSAGKSWVWVKSS